MNNQLIQLILVALVMVSCQPKPQQKGESYDPPGSTDTRTRQVVAQRKAVYTFDGVSASNQFAGARLCDWQREGLHQYTALIRPENTPINNSAWYAFKLWSATPQTVTVHLRYEGGNHRYYPKVSHNGRTWLRLNADQYEVIDTAHVRLTLRLDADTLWVAGQELYTAQTVREWVRTIDSLPFAFAETFGKSKQGRPLPMLTLSEPTTPLADVVVVMGRQHPPEVTGQIALHAFVETMAADTDLAKRFRAKFQVLVFPMLNPDGVDNGHWRHNNGGIDLNRDWVNFNQPETRQLAQLLQKRTKNGAKVWFALDFHATQEDVIYTLADSVVPRNAALVQRWLNAMRTAMPQDTFYEEPFGLESPVSKNWLFRQLHAEAVTFEFGDEIPRPYLKQKAQVAATELMKILLSN